MVKPFGQERNDAMDRLEAEVRAEGVTGAEVFFEADRRWCKEQQGMPTFRERQEVMNFKWGMDAEPARRARTILPHEYDYLIERLAMVNDPVGIGIREKLHRMRR